jgi:putative transposase
MILERRSAQMPRRRFTDEQVAFALRQAEAGTAVGEICRKMGVSEATFYLYGRLSRCKAVVV